MNGDSEKQLFQTLGEIKATTKANANRLVEMHKAIGTLFDKLNENGKDIVRLEEQQSDCSEQVSKCEEKVVKCNERVDNAIDLQNRKHGFAAAPGSGALLWQVAEFIKGLFN